jgi:outer membrane protein OmpA-like peptidoglycan-associated protein
MDAETKKKRRRRMPWIALSVAIGIALLSVGGVVSFAAMQGAGAHKAGKQASAFAEAPAWVGSIIGDLKANFDWLGLAFGKGVAKVSGTAPDLAAKDAGFAAATQALNANPDAKAAIKVIVNAIEVEGQGPSLGAALGALGTDPDAAACDKAFADTLAGRFIAFDSGSARISPESAALLDALTGAALICTTHKVEIGGHTDKAGADDANLALSQARAEAVKTYLTGKGVAAKGLAAIGYGESRPLDPADTAEAYATNRRIEFKVKS